MNVEECNFDKEKPSLNLILEASTFHINRPKSIVNVIETDY